MVINNGASQGIYTFSFFFILSSADLKCIFRSGFVICDDPSHCQAHRDKIKYRRLEDCTVEQIEPLAIEIQQDKVVGVGERKKKKEPLSLLTISGTDCGGGTNLKPHWTGSTT